MPVYVAYYRVSTARQGQSGLWQIYTINADGSGERRLSDGRASDTSPAWSPDGHRIAFARERDRSSGIYVMSADGRNSRRITARALQASQPAWSPRGDRLAFVRSS